ncbi:MAG: hypothetical protein HYV15_06840 [Elusimicrobia bacterium]|nr:hypothetical protein [Elusimicrobiota bacterium]
MAAALAALLCLSASAAPRPAKTAADAVPEASVLREGVWKLSIGGIVCNACTKASIEEVLKLEGVEKATFEFEDGVMLLTVAKGAQVRRSKVERALRTASRRADLDTRFTLAQASYEGPDGGKPAKKEGGAPPPAVTFPVPTP